MYRKRQKGNLLGPRQTYQENQYRRTSNTNINSIIEEENIPKIDEKTTLIPNRKPLKRENAQNPELRHQFQKLEETLQKLEKGNSMLKEMIEKIGDPEKDKPKMRRKLERALTKIKAVHRECDAYILKIKSHKAIENDATAFSNVKVITGQYEQLKKRYDKLLATMIKKEEAKLTTHRDFQESLQAELAGLNQQTHNYLDEEHIRQYQQREKRIKKLEREIEENNKRIAKQTHEVQRLKIEMNVYDNILDTLEHETKEYENTKIHSYVQSNPYGPTGRRTSQVPTLKYAHKSPRRRGKNNNTKKCLCLCGCACCLFITIFILLGGAAIGIVLYLYIQGIIKL
mmetsp:Transcript_8819/g.13075  ORF Transcript_8819/g.13075 Transcript_8819/m.13075 type:complete len:342 (-) Transcript_8819:7-1032(-)